jgi:hypothetical protein
MRALILLGTCALVSLFASATVSATASADAYLMPLGTWPTQLQCLTDDAGNPTAFRLEEITVTDAPDQGNVLTRPFPDTTCPTSQ